MSPPTPQGVSIGALMWNSFDAGRRQALVRVSACCDHQFLFISFQIIISDKLMIVGIITYLGSIAEIISA